jgi:SAM-dependent methyltransferase
MTSLGLVVPVFDEEVRFPEYGKLLADYVAARPAGSELVFVDDGSTDGTAALADELAASRPDVAIRVLRCPHVGKGAAVAAGLAAVTTDLAGFCDLDLSTPLEQFDRVVAAAEGTASLAIGSRDLTGSRLLQRESRLRESLGRAYNRLLQATVTPGIVDTQCGAKVAPTSTWAAILPHCRQVGFAWDAEVVAVAQALGIRVHEVPIEWRHDDRSKIRVGRDGLAMVRETGRIWRSAKAARASRPPRAASGVGEASDGVGVFEGANADELLGADATHWWFRGKAALVTTALRRTAGRDRPTGGLLVDAGAGGGGVTAQLGWGVDRAVALEGSAVLVAHARRRHGLLAARSLVVPLPLASGSADVVCLLDVIEHLADPVPALVEARRVLRPGGRLVVNVPAHRWLWSAADEHLGHHRRYDRAELHRHLAAAGLHAILESHVYSWLVPFVWLERRRAAADAPGLGLDRTSFVIDRTAMVLTTIERVLLGRLRLPFGTSLLCVATADDGR